MIKLEPQKYKKFKIQNFNFQGTNTKINEHDNKNRKVCELDDFNSPVLTKKYT